MTPTITAFEASPDRGLGLGLARDMPVRWVLEEVGRACEVRLVSFAGMKAAAHKARQPFVQIHTRLGDLSRTLGEAPGMEGAFSAGDLMMISVLRRLNGTGILGAYPNLAAYVARGEARPAFGRAFEAQRAVFEKPNLTDIPDGETAMTDSNTLTEPKFALTLERVMNAPVEKVWRCWTEPSLLEQWFCPKPWYVTDARMDLRPAGESFSVMNGPDGERFENIGVYLEVVPMKKIVTTDAFLPGWVPSGRAFMVAETLFEDAGGGKTKYAARALHWSEEAMKEHEAMGFHEGWGMAADQLEALVKTL